MTTLQLPEVRTTPPINAVPGTIGKLVTVQIFKYSGRQGEEGQVISESLSKYIGVMEAIVTLPDQFGFKLHGCDAIYSYYEQELVEIYIQGE